MNRSGFEFGIDLARNGNSVYLSDAVVVAYLLVERGEQPFAFEPTQRHDNFHQEDIGFTSSVRLRIPRAFPVVTNLSDQILPL